MKKTLGMLLATSAVVLVTPAAAKVGDPIAIAPDLSLDIIANARLRYEAVDVATAAAHAEAVTARLRVGAELRTGLLSLLVEGEGTGALADRYNDTLPGNGVEPFPVIADPENLELNRAQLAFGKDGTLVTVGRQRINLDNQRFVGAVGFRQNEQTFDAVRGQVRLGKFGLDATWALSQRTIFGTDSPSAHFDGDLVLMNAAYDGKAFDVAAFSYLLDYEARPAFSSATYGMLAQGSVPAGTAKISGQFSIATQSDFGANPGAFSVTYLNAELGAAVRGFTLGAGYELLGSEGGTAAFQTPLATMHAFNGWADMFLTTPAAGLQDLYLKAGYAVPNPPVPGLALGLVWHRYRSDFGSIDYGSEWNASVGFKLGPISLLAKYAAYDADGFGADTNKAWIQAEYGF